MQETGQIMHPEGLHPYLFDRYMKANATIPQASDGIKWMVHYAFFSNPVATLTAFATSRFNQDQLHTLRIKTNAIHHANNIPFQAPTHGNPVPPHKTEILDEHYHILMTRVTHSLVNNLVADQHFMDTGTPLPEYKNDLDHDVQVPTPQMVSKADSYVKSPKSYFFKELLSLINRTVVSDEGKALLKQYREEFSVNGKRTSSVWRAEGYREKFAHLVGMTLGDFGMDVSSPHTSYLLHLNNL